MSPTIPRPTRAPTTTRSQRRSGSASPASPSPHCSPVSPAGAPCNNAPGDPADASPCPPRTRVVIETQLRAADDRDTLEVLRAALLLLARRCAQAGRLLPALAAVRVNRTDIELLLLTDDTDPVAPFDATEKDRWHLAFADVDVHSDDLADDGDGVPFPYPALLTIHAADDTTMLIDLEAAGTLTVLGPPEQTRPIIDAWAVELASAPISETIGLTLVGVDWPATAVDAARVRLAGTVKTAARSAAARARAVDAILTHAHLTTVREARSRGVAPDIWDPEVVLCMASDPDEDEAEYNALSGDQRTRRRPGHQPDRQRVGPARLDAGPDREPPLANRTARPRSHAAPSREDPPGRDHRRTRRLT